MTVLEDKNQWILSFRYISFGISHGFHVEDGPSQYVSGMLCRFHVYTLESKHTTPFVRAKRFVCFVLYLIVCCYIAAMVAIKQDFCASSRASELYVGTCSRSITGEEGGSDPMGPMIEWIVLHVSSDLGVCRGVI